MAIATQGYWSKAHTDNDYYYSLLSVLSKESKHHEEVIYYFTFPEYKTSVPMKSGDVIMFNSKVLHCSSNGKHYDDFIYSIYVSDKTTLTKGIEFMNDSQLH